MRKQTANFTTNGAPRRIATMDITRGVAVMGILAMNIVGFALPSAAYSNPTVMGMDSAADLLSWLVSFILIDGRMRGLFSLLFGASMMLLIRRSEEAGGDSANDHFTRMATLLLFGLIHFYAIWWGDILLLYAVTGSVAWFFRNQPARRLLIWAAALFLMQTWIFASIALTAAGIGTDGVGGAAAMAIARQFEPAPEDVAASIALYRGSYGDILRYQWTDNLLLPLEALLYFGWEALGYMLLGMAAFKTGFFERRWSPRAYHLLMLVGLGGGIVIHVGLALAMYVEKFSTSAITLYGLTAVTPFRPPMVLGLAALIILHIRPDGWLGRRIGAAGRAAFTNYLGTSVCMTALFYGYGLGWFATLSRAELWWVVLVMWAVMLTWSKPWLDRFRYGPLEWLWRSLARGAPQPMRR